MSRKPKRPDVAISDDAVTSDAEEPGASQEDASRAPEATVSEPASNESEASAGAKDPGDPKELKMQLEEARAVADTHWDTVLRTRAELENLRKRSERDLENAHKYGAERFVSEMLPVKDSLELGLSASRGDEVSVESVREGMELTLKMFAAALDKLGVTEVNPEGEGFDPEFHQAMTMQEAEGQASGTVISVIQKGYVLNERLIRPALVVVAK